MKRIPRVLLVLFFLVSCGHVEYNPDLHEATSLPTAVSSSHFVDVANVSVDSAAEPGQLPTTLPDPNVIETFMQSGYTKENPLTDPVELTKLLNALEELQYNNFKRAGWYRMTCGEEEILWLHFSEPETRLFDQSLWLRNYPIYPKINVASILLKDGTFGSTVFKDIKMEDYVFHKPYIPDKNHLLYDEYIRPEETHLRNIDWYFVPMSFGNFEVEKRRLRGEDGYMDPLYPGHTRSTFEYKAWVDSYNGQDVLAFEVYEDVVYGTQWTDITGEFVAYNIDMAYFSAEDGRQLYLLNNGADVKGFVFDPYDLNPECPGKISYYEQLPEDIQILYDEAEQRLIEFNAGG